MIILREAEHLAYIIELSVGWSTACQKLPV